MILCHDWMDIRLRAIFMWGRDDTKECDAKILVSIDAREKSWINQCGQEFPENICLSRSLRLRKQGYVLFAISAVRKLL